MRGVHSSTPSSQSHTLPLLGPSSSSPSISVFSLLTPRTSTSSTTARPLPATQLVPSNPQTSPSSVPPFPSPATSASLLSPSFGLATHGGATPKSSGPSPKVVSESLGLPDFEAGSFQKWLGKSVRNRRLPSSIASSGLRQSLTPSSTAMTPLPIQKQPLQQGNPNVTAPSSSEPPPPADPGRPSKCPRLSDAEGRDPGETSGVGGPLVSNQPTGEGATNALGVELGVSRSSAEPTLNRGSSVARPSTPHLQLADLHGAAQAVVRAPKFLSLVSDAAFRTRVEPSLESRGQPAPSHPDAPGEEALSTDGPPSTSPRSDPVETIAATPTQEKATENSAPASISSQATGSAVPATEPASTSSVEDAAAEMDAARANLDQCPGGTLTPAATSALEQVVGDDSLPAEGDPAGTHVESSLDTQAAESEDPAPSSPSSTQSAEDHAAPPAAEPSTGDWNLLNNRPKRSGRQSTKGKAVFDTDRRIVPAYRNRV